MMKRSLYAVAILFLASIVNAQNEKKADAPTTTAASSGALLDVAPFGYAFRTDRPISQNPPETQWLTN